MNDLNEKIDLMIDLINQERNAVFQQLQDDYKAKIEDYDKKVSNEIEKIKEEKIKEAEKEASSIINLAKAKAEFIVKQEKLKMKNEFLASFLEELKSSLMNLDEKDKIFLYRKLYYEASKMLEGKFIVFCNPKDVKIVKSIAKGESVKADESIDGGIVLKSGDLSVYNTLDSYINENKSKILKLLAKEVGEL